jgi:hypothetical protein
LDAIEPNQLRKLVEDAILSHMDIEGYEHELRQQAPYMRQSHAIRTPALSLICGNFGMAASVPRRQDRIGTSHDRGNPITAVSCSKRHHAKAAPEAARRYYGVWHVLPALRTKRAELDGELHQIEQRADQLGAEPDAIDRVILIFDPTARPAHIAPKTRRQSIFAFRRGELCRQVNAVATLAMACKPSVDWQRAQKKAC